MILILNKDQINHRQWKDLVEQSSTASFFQTPECFEFYSSLSFMSPFLYGVSENNKLTGVICGYIIADGNVLKQYFSKRAIVPGGMLLDSTISVEALTSLMSEVKKRLKSRAIYLEFRNYNDYGEYRNLLESLNFEYKEHLNFHVDTQDVETALKNLSTTKRRDIKLSKKNGADWFLTNDMDDVKAYYEILEHLYKTRIKTPLFPFSFFESLVKNPLGKLFIVKHEGKVIGGSVCVVLPGQSLYEWFVCGLDGQVKNVFPSTIATWAAIEFAAENGLRKFDMMGAGKPDEGYGVREFKSKFGGELVEHGRFIYVCQPLLYKLGKKAVEILKKKN